MLFLAGSSAGIGEGVVLRQSKRQGAARQMVLGTVIGVFLSVITLCAIKPLPFEPYAEVMLTAIDAATEVVADADPDPVDDEVYLPPDVRRSQTVLQCARTPTQWPRTAYLPTAAADLTQPRGPPLAS